MIIKKCSLPYAAVFNLKHQVKPSDELILPKAINALQCYPLQTKRVVINLECLDNVTNAHVLFLNSYYDYEIVLLH